MYQFIANIFSVALSDGFNSSGLKPGNKQKLLFLDQISISLFVTYKQKGYRISMATFIPNRKFQSIRT